MRMKQGVLTDEAIKRSKFAYERAKTLMNVAEAKLEKTKQNLESAKIILNQMNITAPVDGTILKIYSTIGEYISNANNTMIIGNLEPLYIKTQINGTDIPYFNHESKTVAVQRSITSDPIPLTFIKADLIVIPKTNLRGLSAEIIDTRVLEITYALPKTHGLYFGLFIDTYIEKGKIK